MLMNNKEHALQDRFSVTLLLGAKDTLLPKVEHGSRAWLHCLPEHNPALQV